MSGGTKYEGLVSETLFRRYGQDGVLCLASYSVYCDLSASDF